jgi:hypothetical protein
MAQEQALTPASMAQPGHCVGVPGRGRHRGDDGAVIDHVDSIGAEGEELAAARTVEADQP